MRFTDETYGRLTAGLYEAGLGERGWYHAIRDVTDAFDGAGGVIFDVDTRGGGIVDWIGPGLEEGADDYIRHLHAVNPRMHFSLRAPAGTLAWDYRVLPKDEMPRDEFYDWVRNRQGLGYFLGTRLFDDHELGVSTFTAVEFSGTHGHASKDEIRLFALLTDHVANAWRLTRLMQRQHVSARIGELFEAHSRSGLITLDRLGRIRSMNERAAAAVRHRDGLYLHRGSLFLRKAADTRKLQGLLGACLQAVAGGPPSAGGAMAVPRPGGRPHIILRVMPIMPRPGPCPPGLPAVVVMLDDPVAPIAVHPRELRAIYGFSRRETALAVALSAGVPLREAAATAGMGYNTARTHLRGLFDKSGTRTQLQLVSALRSLENFRTH